MGYIILMAGYPGAKEENLLSSTRVTPIAAIDAPTVEQYLIPRFQGGRSAEQWKRVLRWMVGLRPPNLGFQLIADGRIVGVFLATYDMLDDERVICHLGTWIVDDGYRSHSLPLFKALLAQKVDAFTDYKPLQHVLPINRRLGFSDMDTRAQKVWNFGWPLYKDRHGAKIVTRASRIEGLLSGRDLRIFGDHRSIPGLGQLAVVEGDRVCLVVYRRSKGKIARSRLLYATNTSQLRASLGLVLWRIGLRCLSLRTVVEDRTLGGPVESSRPAPATPRQYKGKTLHEGQLTELYSPLVWYR
jgi:hypothetical protein